VERSALLSGEGTSGLDHPPAGVADRIDQKRRRSRRFQARGVVDSLIELLSGVPRGYWLATARAGDLDTVGVVRGPLRRDTLLTFLDHFAATGAFRLDTEDVIGMPISGHTIAAGCNRVAAACADLSNAVTVVSLAILNDSRTVLGKQPSAPGARARGVK
jgi:hypothetical protein